MPRKYFLNYAVYVDQYIKIGQPSYDGSMTCYGCVADININENETASHSFTWIQLQPIPRKYFLNYAVYVDQYIKTGHPFYDAAMTCYGCIDNYFICIQLHPMPRKYFLPYAV